MDLISIVVPCLNEEAALPIYYREMSKIMEKMKEAEFELIFVDDGSTDGTLEEMRKLCRQDGRCRYLSFSRNFGKEAAIYAGLSNARGDYGAVMDVDLQDPPELLPEMYRILREEDYDSVAARRGNREGEPRIRSFLSDCFYRFIDRICGAGMMPGARDYRLMKRRMLDAVLQLGERTRFTKGIFGWVGFQTKWLEYDNVERRAGETKWSLGKLFLYALEGIFGFSTKPLMVSVAAGTVFLGLSSLLLLAGIVQSLGQNGILPGTILLAAALFLVGGVQLFCTGISGWYLSRTYQEVKGRPIYLLRESSGDQEEEQRKTANPLVQIQKKKEEETCRQEHCFSSKRQKDRKRQGGTCYESA